MLENIITNPIETPRGYKNPDYGIALRGPLSQFFSALYLKPLDDAFNNMDVTYLRYQDDILILCKTKRQLQRCKHRLIDILQAKRLRLSRKKTRIGSIDQGFHFLGIHYLGTQPLDKTNVTQEHSGPVQRLKSANSLLIVSGGGRQVRRLLARICLCNNHVSFRMRERYVMHANKLNKWSLMGSRTKESGVTCLDGARGG